MSKWTKTVSAAVEALWRAGQSASQIARELHLVHKIYVTRNAVIGRLHRLRLTEADRDSPVAIKRKLGNAGGILRRGRRGRRNANGKASDGGVLHRLAQARDAAAAAAMASSLDPAEIPVRQRKQLLELGPNDCRFPYGDPGSNDFFFCGAPQEPGCSYCLMHARMAFRAAPCGRIGRDYPAHAAPQNPSRLARSRGFYD